VKQSENTYKPLYEVHNGMASLSRVQPGLQEEMECLRKVWAFAGNMHGLCNLQGLIMNLQGLIMSSAGQQAEGRTVRREAHAT
jgi:hypothetical protein